MRLAHGRAVPGHEPIERRLIEVRERSAPTRGTCAFKKRRRQSHEISRQQHARLGIEHPEVAGGDGVRFEMQLQPASGNVDWTG